MGLMNRSGIMRKPIIQIILIVSLLLIGLASRSAVAAAPGTPILFVPLQQTNPDDKQAWIAKALGDPLIQEITRRAGKPIIYDHAIGIDDPIHALEGGHDMQ